MSVILNANYDSTAGYVSSPLGFVTSMDGVYKPMYLKDNNSSWFIPQYSIDAGTGQTTMEFVDFFGTSGIAGLSDTLSEFIVYSRSGGAVVMEKISIPETGTATSYFIHVDAFGAKSLQSYTAPASTLPSSGVGLLNMVDGVASVMTGAPGTSLLLNYSATTGFSTTPYTPPVIPPQATQLRSFSVALNQNMFINASGYATNYGRVNIINMIDESTAGQLVLAFDTDNTAGRMTNILSTAVLSGSFTSSGMTSAITTGYSFTFSASPNVSAAPGALKYLSVLF